MESENAKLEHEMKNISKRLKELNSRIKQTKLENTDINRKLKQWWEFISYLFFFKYIGCNTIKIVLPQNDFDSGFLGDDKLLNLGFLFFIVAYCMFNWAWTTRCTLSSSSSSS